jgi:hypothetical protein
MPLKRAEQRLKARLIFSRSADRMGINGLADRPKRRKRPSTLFCSPLRSSASPSDRNQREYIYQPGSWDRSTTWSQFRSTRRQRGWWLDGVRRDRRVRPHRSARCKMRGVVPDPRCGVAKFAADGPGRLSTSVSRACWTGPPPSRSPRAATGHDRLARSSRRSPSGGAACGFWIRAWSHASPLFKQPAA